MIDSSDCRLDFYRGPLKTLLEDVMSANNSSRKEAKKAIRLILRYMEAKVWAGQEVDFGFLKIEPTTLSPLKVKSKLKTAEGTYYIGERLKWKVRISKKWQKTTEPAWAKL